MKILKISEDKALELYKTASNEFKELLEENFGRDFFKPKEITDIVDDIDTLCEHLGLDESDLFIFSKNTKDKHERFINACNILPKISKVYNEGKVLNWEDTSEYKYLPYLSFRPGSRVVDFAIWSSYCIGPFGFYYKSEKLAKESYNNFQKYWKDYWEYNK